ETEARLREIERLALILEVRARDREALLRAAQLEIVARDFCRDQHLRVTQARVGRAGFGAGGFHAAAHSAAQIELPQRRETDFVALDVEPLVAETGLLPIAFAVRDLRGHVRPARALGGAELRASFGDARGCDLQIEVAAQSARD